MAKRTDRVGGLRQIDYEIRSLVGSRPSEVEPENSELVLDMLNGEIERVRVNRAKRRDSIGGKDKYTGKIKY